MIIGCGNRPLEARGLLGSGHPLLGTCDEVSNPTVRVQTPAGDLRPFARKSRVRRSDRVRPEGFRRRGRDPRVETGGPEVRPPFHMRWVFGSLALPRPPGYFRLRGRRGAFVQKHSTFVRPMKVRCRVCSSDRHVYPPWRAGRRHRPQGTLSGIDQPL